MADAERLAKLREDLEKACKAQKFSKILKKLKEVGGQSRQKDFYL